MSSANAWRPTRDSGLQDWGCSAPRPLLASCHGGVETPVIPSPPPSPGHGHCGRCCFRWFSKQTCLSQFLITKSKKHARFLSQYRTCFWLILKPLFIWRQWVSASVCGLSAGDAGFSGEVHALFSHCDKVTLEESWEPWGQQHLLAPAPRGSGGTRASVSARPCIAPSPRGPSLGIQRPWQSGFLQCGGPRGPFLKTSGSYLLLAPDPCPELT